MKTIEINGRTFEVVNKRDKESLKSQIRRHKDNFSYRDIWDAYGRPSCTKVHIWDEWKNWQSQTKDVTYFEVAGAGSHAFSIEGVYTDAQGNEGLMRITKCYDRIFM
jgi:hypothetical protein